MADSDVEEEKGVINQSVVAPLIEFYHDSTNLLRRCNKPDRKEFMRVLYATGVGFLIMGALGFLIKLVHIPINNILVGA